MFSLLCHHYDSERSFLAFTRIHGTASNSILLLGRGQGAYTQQTPTFFGGGIYRWPFATETELIR